MATSKPGKARKAKVAPTAAAAARPNPYDDTSAIDQAAEDAGLGPKTLDAPSAAAIEHHPWTFIAYKPNHATYRCIAFDGGPNPLSDLHCLLALELRRPGFLDRTQRWVWSGWVTPSSAQTFLCLGGRGVAPSREKRGSRDFPSAEAGKTGINNLMRMVEHGDDRCPILIGPAALQFSAKVNGSLFTIRRDTRFSNDKRPYKEELGLKFWHGDNRKACQSTLHMRITSTFVGSGAGIWTFEPAELLTYRAAVADDVLGPELVAAMAGLRQRQCVWPKDAYKKVPAPYPADHPRQDLLRRRGLAVGFDAPLPASLHDASFVDSCVHTADLGSAGVDGGVTVVAVVVAGDEAGVGAGVGRAVRIAVAVTVGVGVPGARRRVAVVGHVRRHRVAADRDHLEQLGVLVPVADADFVGLGGGRDGRNGKRQRPGRDEEMTKSAHDLPSQRRTRCAAPDCLEMRQRSARGSDRTAPTEHKPRSELARF